MLVVVHMAEHDGRGAAQAASMRGPHHLEPSPGIDLVRAEYGAHLIVEDFRRRPGERAEPRRLQGAQKSREGNAKRRSALMHFERREGVDVKARRGALHGVANLEICGPAVKRVDTALHAYLARAARPCLARALRDLREREFIRPAAQIFAHLPLGEGTEPAFEVTDVGVIDVASDHVRDGLTIARLSQLVSCRADRRKLVPATAKQPHDVAFAERIPSLSPCQDRGEFIGNRWTAKASSTIGKPGAGTGGPVIGARPSIGVDASEEGSPQCWM